MIDINHILENSSDSVVESYFYSGNFLTINLTLGDLDKTIKLKIKTDSLSINNFYLEKKEELFRTCRLELRMISEILNIKNNFYMPPNEFENIMKESKQKYNLAYGKKSSEIKYILYLIGYDILLACLIKDFDCIEIITE